MTCREKGRHREHRNPALEATCLRLAALHFSLLAYILMDALISEKARSLFLRVQRRASSASGEFEKLPPKPSPSSPLRLADRA